MLYESTTLLLLILFVRVPWLLTVMNVPPLILMSDAPAKNDISSNRERVEAIEVSGQSRLGDERGDERERGEEDRHRPYTDPQSVA